MTERHHRPVSFAGYKFEAFEGGSDPAAISRLAHETANALLSRVRQQPDDDVLDRLVAFTDTNGIDAIAELWSRASARSLPGTLWRMYLLRSMIRSDADGNSLFFQRGVDVSRTIDPVVAGAPDPAGPLEVVALADEILRGVFSGDLAVALDRAAAFARVSAAGCTSVADDLEPTEPARATELTRRALRLSEVAADLSACSKLWRSGGLD